MSGSLRPAATENRVPRGPLSRVVYRSRAIGAPTAAELARLTETAQGRNRREAVTGVMLYDDRRFFQWLEGPKDGVDRIMGSIYNDRRHTEIEVLSDQPTPSRTFADWSMKLATPGAKPASQLADAIDPPEEVIEMLRRQPEAAPVVLVRLLPTAPVPDASTSMNDAMARMPLQASVAEILKAVMLATVLPRLTAQAGTQGLLPPCNPRSADLADMLIAADPAAAQELIQELDAAGTPTSRLYSTLFEPAARILGDLWSEDGCTEFDVTLGLCRLQAAIRMLGANRAARRQGGVARPTVLITPEPGELHRLGASLDSDVLWQAGWAPRIEFPAGDMDLQDLVAGAWVDVLDLSLSTAFRREDMLPRLTETITKARLASQNPALVVVVGGRTFYERDTDAGAVGADTATRSAARMDQVILQTLATASTTKTLSAAVSAS
jgi:hypothetical protein